jgi:uncharacterized protein (DUF2141 family)
MNSTLKITLLLAFMALFGQAQNALTVHVTGLKSSDGKVMIELVNASGKAVAQQVADISNKKSEIVFDNLKSGKYAIRYYHDENSNGKMDTGTFGIPTEGYGFSNNARGFMGPPDFEDMVFAVNSNAEVTLKTKN